MLKQTIYLVDSENVNDAWIKLLPKLKRWDKVIVFHTKNSPHFSTESASVMNDFDKRNLSWEKCFTGTNGLDFQLITRLGYLVCKRPRATFVIVSNDTGFDAAVKYWVQEGYSVSRIRGASCKEDGPLEEVQEEIRLEDAPDKSRRRMHKNRTRTARPEEKQRVQKKKPGEKIKLAEKKTTEKKSFEKKEKPVAKKELPVVCQKSLPMVREEKPVVKKLPISSSVEGITRSISLNRNELLHESLVALLGPKEGREVYVFLRENKEVQAKLGQSYLAGKDERVDNYLKVVFEHHKVEMENMDMIRSILNKYPANDRNGVYRALIAAYGNKKGGEYYTMLKQHIRVIQKL